MGPAISVTVKGQTIYVCCQGCVAKVQRDPDGYLRKVEAERGQQSQGTSSQSNSSSLSFSGSGGRSDSVVANASPASSLPTQSRYGGQTICPVTGAPLGSMGTPIPVTVKGQTIYVCCQGCVAKVQRDPDTYLRKVQAERNGQSHNTSSPSNSSSLSGGGGCCHGGGGCCCGH